MAFQSPSGHSALSNTAWCWVTLHLPICFNPHRGILLFLTEGTAALHRRLIAQFQSPSGHSALSNGAPGLVGARVAYSFNPHRGILLFLTHMAGHPISARAGGFNPHRGILLFLTLRMPLYGAAPMAEFQSPSGHSALSNATGRCFWSRTVRCFNPHRGILLFLTSIVRAAGACADRCFNPHRGILLFLTLTRRAHAGVL